MVRFVTELAFYLNRLSVAYDVVQILSAQCRNRTGDALLGAVALECGIHRIVDLKPIKKQIITRMDPRDT